MCQLLRSNRAPAPVQDFGAWLALGGALFAVLVIAMEYDGPNTIPGGPSLIVLSAIWPVLAALVLHREARRQKKSVTPDVPNVTGSSTPVLVKVAALSLALAIVSTASPEIFRALNSLGPSPHVPSQPPATVGQPQFEPRRPAEQGPIQFLDQFEGAWVMHFLDGGIATPVAHVFSARIPNEPWVIWRLHGDNGTPLSIWVTGYNSATQTSDHYTFSLGSGSIYHRGVCGPTSSEVHWSGRDNNGVSSEVTYRVNGDQIQFTSRTGDALQVHGFLQRMPANPTDPQAHDPFTAFYGTWSFDAQADFSDGISVAERGTALIALMPDVHGAVELYLRDSSNALIDARILTYVNKTLIRYWIDAKGNLWMLSGQASGPSRIDWVQGLEGEPAVTAVDEIGLNGLFNSQIECLGVDGQLELTATIVFTRIHP